jgi:hypothetical protein
VRSVYIFALFAGLAATGLTGLSSNQPAFASQTETTTSDAPVVGEIELFYRGDTVDQVVVGNKIRKYSMVLTGTGFVSGSKVEVRSVRAFPYRIHQPKQPVSTGFGSSTSLTAMFRPGTLPPPGLLSVKVVNPDGTESNLMTLDVISEPSALFIASMSAQSGPVGTHVTLTGNGFIPGATNAIRFTPVIAEDPRLVGFFSGFYTDTVMDSGTLSFDVPTSVPVPICPGIRGVVCDPITSLIIGSQLYWVQVINANGMSNSMVFQVTPTVE